MKIGKQSIPNIRLFPKLTNWAYELLVNFELSLIENEEAMARICGHKSANSGAWISKLADMRLYGLVERRNLKMTELAERLVSGTDEDRQKATNQAILNVPLWEALFKQYGTMPPEETFWVQLQRLTGISNMQAQKNADFVRKAYLQDVSFIEFDSDYQDVNEGDIDKKREPNEKIPSDVVGKIIAHGYGEIDIKDAISYEIAKSYLKIFAQKLGIEK